MTGPGISDDDELTPEGLSRSKSDLLSEHGLRDTAIGKAAEKIEEQEERDAALDELREDLEHALNGQYREILKEDIKQELDSE